MIDRSKCISVKEKNDKIFNYKRPTVFLNEDVTIINCYPGMDYVYHYASLIKTYLFLLEIENYSNISYSL